ncbi:NADH-quinone oxidoreductase subunit A [soil metagenome]
MLRSYLPVLVFTGLGVIVGSALVMLNNFTGPKRPSKVKSDPYECGLPTEVERTFRFGISFYMIAMLFILFDIEVVFLYPVGILLGVAKSVFILVEVIVFIGLLTVALVYVWRRGALDWK